MISSIYFMNKIKIPDIVFIVLINAPIIYLFIRNLLLYRFKNRLRFLYNNEKNIFIKTTLGNLILNLNYTDMLFSFKNFKDFLKDIELTILLYHGIDI